MLALTSRRLFQRALLAKSLNPMANISPMTTMPHRQRHSLPYNSVIVFVPHQEAWVIERMGKFHKILEPGVNFLLPVLDSIRYVQSLKEMAFEIPQQSAITADNVNLSIDGVLYLKVFDPYKASYHIENPEFSVTQLAQTSMRSEIGKIQLDSVFRERESLNTIIVGAINSATSPWGISCLRYEIRDIKLPDRVQEAMQLQVEAERKKRAQILESEGVRDAEINVAQGQANAIMAKAKAKAEALTVINNAIKPQAASFVIAEKYIQAFSNLARSSNTMIIPSEASDVSKMVAQAFQVYRSMSSSPQLQNLDVRQPNSTASRDLDLEDSLLGDLDEFTADKKSSPKFNGKNSSASPNKTNKR